MHVYCVASKVVQPATVPWEMRIPKQATLNIPHWLGTVSVQCAVIIEPAKSGHCRPAKCTCSLSVVLNPTPHSVTMCRACGEHVESMWGACAHQTTQTLKGMKGQSLQPNTLHWCGPVGGQGGVIVVSHVQGMWHQPM